MEDFGGITLQVGVIGADLPFSNVTIGQGDRYYGFMIDILDHVAMLLNFRYVLIEPADGHYGSQLVNGTWTGIINMVQRQEVVFGAAAFTMNVERSRVVDFTKPFMENTFGILTSKPKEYRHIFQFLKPLSRNVWLLILLCGITTCITLISVIHLSECKHKANVQMISPQDRIFDVIASFCEQGVQSYPSSISARCLLGFWHFFCLLVATIYTANLAAVLTVSDLVKPINSLKDLSERTDLDVILLGGSSSWMLFQMSKEPVHQEIFKRAVERTTLEDSLQKVLSGKACYISETAYLQYIASLTCGQVRIAEEKFQNQLWAFPIQKNSPFKKPIDDSIQKIMEAGIMEMWRKKWFDRKRPTYCKRPPNEGDKDYKLDMESIVGVFILFAGCVSLSVLYCVIERILLPRIRTLINVCMN